MNYDGARDEHYVNHRHEAPTPEFSNRYIFWGIIYSNYSGEEIKRLKHLANCGMDVPFDEDDGA